MVTSSEALPFQAVLALTEQLMGGSSHRLPWMQIRKILDDLTEGHIWLGYPMPIDWGIFRGRVENGVDLFENVSQLSCRDPRDVKDYGRCHRPAVAIYYGANNLDTVLSELSPEVGDRVHVAIARPKVDGEVVLTAIGEIDHVRRHNRALIGNEETLRIIQELLDNVKSESDLRKVFLDAFMADLIARDNEIYIYSHRINRFSTIQGQYDDMPRYRLENSNQVSDGDIFGTLENRGLKCCYQR